MSPLDAQSQPGIDYEFITTRLGKLIVATTDKGVCLVSFVNAGQEADALEVLHKRFPELNLQHNPRPPFDISWQLHSYCAGRRTRFSAPRDLHGTPFLLTVWNMLCQIPYGETRTYKQVAVAIGAPTASRAVGLACNRNPLCIIIPCHRVVGSNGHLTGYAAGLEIKRQLLALEKRHGRT